MEGGEGGVSNNQSLNCSYYARHPGVGGWVWGIVQQPVLELFLLRQTPGMEGCVCVCGGGGVVSNNQSLNCSYNGLVCTCIHESDAQLICMCFSQTF